MSVAVLGAGAGGIAAVAELSTAGHDVALWNRSEATLAPLKAQSGVRFSGVIGEGFVELPMITGSIAEAIRSADVAVVCLPTFSHAPVAKLLAEADWPSDKPVVLNPGHTGGALEFATAFARTGRQAPPVAELSTLTYVARKYAPETVTVTCRAKSVRAAALPGGDAALEAAVALFPGATAVPDVLCSSLANANLVLHPPGSVLAAAWVEARQGDFTFYVDAMTPGVARTMQALDEERCRVARAFGHEMPHLIEEMKLIGTVEPDADPTDYAAAVAGGGANKNIKAPDSLTHRYYREDFGHGVLPFLALAEIAGVETPVARSLLTLAEAAVGVDYRVHGRTAEAMGIAGLDRDGLLRKVRGA
ncbi:NAD/NADP octopine/nopaline dehydrogenase family protein [Acuticoccus mangrovi]|uniref:2-dehydropantoate 2-reductase n=1 Tax=Acuticoccus mangrovi TaxID=2796142 RepID=A0A934IRI2_9HYPH|nr:NAD/NADP octopine/nopaline dehydrogenase family protein [Acuticoccus mangrovi]MBJ3776730.1 NAD/NADP octopine/nopaline dehydrogenase family protein [Acuticoccus mangrovi]